MTGTRTLCAVASSVLVASLTTAFSVAPASATTRQCLSQQSISGVTYTGQWTGYVDSTSGTYPGIVNFSKAITHTNTRSGTLSISKGIVDAGVGFDTSRSETTTASFSLNTAPLGPGTYVVYASNVFDGYRYNIRTVDAACVVRTGTGHANKWVRYAFNWYKA